MATAASTIGPTIQHPEPTRAMTDSAIPAHKLGRHFRDKSISARYALPEHCLRCSVFFTTHQNLQQRQYMTGYQKGCVRTEPKGGTAQTKQPRGVPSNRLDVR